jgi:chromosome partitioning protein
MRVLSFLHQKGGTGKSTLSIGVASSLAATGARVLLLDADYQGTSSEWGNRFAATFRVEVRSQVQPIVHQEAARFAPLFDWLIIDGPPGLSEMTQSVLQAGGRVVVPLRPALPDLWALPWFTALIGKARKAGRVAAPLIVFNQYRGEDLAPLLKEAGDWGLPVYPAPMPDDPAFPRLFLGEALPEVLRTRLLGLSEGISEWSPLR